MTPRRAKITSTEKGQCYDLLSEKTGPVGNSRTETETMVHEENVSHCLGTLGAVGVHSRGGTAGAARAPFSPGLSLACLRPSQGDASLFLRLRKPLLLILLHLWP